MVVSICWSVGLSVCRLNRMLLLSPVTGCAAHTTGVPYVFPVINLPPLEIFASGGAYSWVRKRTTLV